MSTTAKSVIVTGAAAGLGKAIATEFVKRGSSVTLVDIAGDNLRATAQEIGALGLSGQTIAVEANIADEEATASVFGQAIAAFGQVDALVNCAGIMDKFQAVGEHEIPLWNKVMDVNLNGPFLLCRLAAQEFLRTEGGRDSSKGQTGGAGVIINIASVAATRGGVAGAAYTTSKWAMIGLTKSTAAAYAQQGIRCNVICPGSMNTTITNDMDFGSMGQLFGTVLKLNETSAGAADTGRLGRLVAFLCGEDGQDINGAVLRVDRGWTAI